MSDIEPIEVFTGRTVHKVIELHGKNEISNTKEALKTKLVALWRNNWHKEITNQAQETQYKLHAVKCLDNYYLKYSNIPVDGSILVEKKLFGKIAGETITGIIDRLQIGETCVITDYKTGEIPNDKFFETDWQLALYALLINQDTKILPANIELQWEYLAIPKTIPIRKTQKDLEELSTQIENKINIIKTAIKTNVFNKKVTEKCQKCEYFQVSCNGKEEQFEQAITLNSWMQ